MTTTVKDTSVVPAYSRIQDTVPLAALIGNIIGSPEAGTKVMDALLAPGEQATAANIQTRLRAAITSGELQGITPKRLRKLQSALELARQLYFVHPSKGATIDGPESVAHYLQPIAWEPVEKFAVLALDVKHHVLSVSVVSSGTATETLANPRDIFAAVLRAGGVRCIVAHNHPSGATEPSQEDLSLTATLLEAGKVMNIHVLDHLIVSHGKFTSLKQKTDLWYGYEP